MNQTMNLHVLLIAVLVFGAAAGAYSRVIDDREVDNSIEANSNGNGNGNGNKAKAHFEEEWIKFTKAPPARIPQPRGSTIEIVCEVMGSQVPTIQWVVGHFPLSEIDSLESNLISESSPSAIVRVRSVHVVDHTLNEPRTYTCVGRTGAMTVHASTVVYPVSELKDLVQVREKPFQGPHKPRIVYSEKLHLDLVGSNIVLPCRVHARPRADVVWMNGEGQLIEQDSRIKLLPSNDLLISDIKWEDMGAYRCIARNDYGKDTADTFIYPVLKEEK